MPTENNELLIGANHPTLHLYDETKSRNNETVTLHTMLGWVLSGENKKSENCMLNKLTLKLTTDSIIQRIWDNELYGTVAKDDVSIMTT